MKTLQDLFTKLGRDEITAEDFTSIRLKDLPEWGEDDVDYWAVKITSQTGETYGGVVDGGEEKEALRLVALQQAEFGLTIFNTEPLPIIK